MPHLDHLLHLYGYPVITVMLAIECAGILVPGETLMLAAALLASHGHMNIWLVVASAACGAVLGNVGGFAIGRTLGHTLIAKHGGRLGLTPNRMALGRYLFACHGGKMVFFGRFGTFLRSFCPVLAGGALLHGVFAGERRQAPVWAGQHRFRHYRTDRHCDRALVGEAQ
jgi:membrane protein DedA with SNARE-associated domain